MKLLSVFLMFSVSTFCCVSCSSIGRESREKWAKQEHFVSGPDTLLEGAYSNQSIDDSRNLWTIISAKSQNGDVVRLRLMQRNKLAIELIDNGRLVSVLERKITKKDTYWSVGTSIKLHGVPPFVWGVSDNEVGLAVDRKGNLYTSFGISGAGFIGPIGMAGGSGHKQATVHTRIPAISKLGAP